ncbi:hypothetical protein BVRB_1g008340 [Beta vulgaris subsp. vulgaris]|nr:hypothetical protein BVRB_1g008340 [Beta vulgaris subsp. vulgaris]
MAISVRKLLHYYHLTSTTTNHTNTLPCTDFCDPSCGGDFDECYTFPAEPDPLPPLPPPLQPPPIVATPSSTTTTTHDSLHLSPLLIVIIIVLASAFLLVSYYAIVIKYCTFWTRLIRRSNSDHLVQPHNNNHHHPDHDRINHMLVNNPHDHNNPVIDHPIWLISTVGLHQSVINSITVIRYKKEDGLIDGTDCSVCLSEFQHGESLRLLPKCKHAFHIDCIDTWLRSHTNCPMCRADIVVNSGRPSMASNEPSFGHSRRAEFTPMLDSDSSDVELGGSQTGNNNNNNNSSSSNNHNNNNNVSLVVENRGDIGDFEVVVDIDQSKMENDINDVALLVRSSSSRPLPPRIRVMKRSYSWSERVFWSARNQNDRSSDISP